VAGGGVAGDAVPGAAAAVSACPCVEDAQVGLR